MITERFVLPGDADLRPVDALAEEVRARFPHRPGDYVISRNSGRAGTHVVDAASAELIEQFRAGMTISDAVIAFSRTADVDPERVLTDVWPVLQKLIRAKMLVPERGAATVGVSPRLAIGERIDGWTAVSCVYLLEDTELWQVRDAAGRWYALKLVRSTRDAVVVERFRREAEILTVLDGRAGPRLAGRGESYLVLAWCPGSDVERVAAEYRAWPRADGRRALLELVTGMADSYATLHALGVVHGDVHPGNLLVDRDGRVTVLDFAFARRSVGDDEGPRGGMPYYYEPELARAVMSGDVLPQATVAGEQFAIAAVAYRLLTGSQYRDFPLDRAAFWRAVVEDAPRPFAAAGAEAWPEVEGVLARALAKDPGDRYPSVAAFADALRAAGNSGSSIVAPSVPANGSPSARALALVDRVLERVGTSAPGASGSLVSASAGSVMEGTGGVAYMLYRLALARDDAKLLALADLWAERALDATLWPTDSQPSSPASPWHSVSGVHVVRALIAKAAGDEPSAHEALRDFISASTPAASATTIDPDLTLGDAGVLLAAAALVEAGLPRAPLIAHAARLYSELCQKLACLPSMDVPFGLTTSGVAHGWAGALYAAIRWCAATGTAVEPVVRQRLDELATYAEPYGRGTRWAWHLGATEPVYATGWCNGTTGMTLLWTLAGRLLRDAAFEDLADRSAWHAWEHAGRSADLCCGNAGAAYAMLARHQVTGDAAWHRRAQSLTERAVLHIAEEHSLFRGDAGVALLVVELACGADAGLPFFGHEGWPRLAGNEQASGY